MVKLKNPLSLMWHVIACLPPFVGDQPRANALVVCGARNGVFIFKRYEFNAPSIFRFLVKTKLKK